MRFHGSCSCLYIIFKAISFIKLMFLTIMSWMGVIILLLHLINLLVQLWGVWRHEYLFKISYIWMPKFATVTIINIFVKKTVSIFHFNCQTCARYDNVSMERNLTNFDRIILQVKTNVLRSLYIFCWR